MRLKPDKVLRDKLFTPESYQHPAKGHLGLWFELLEQYTKPREWVLGDGRKRPSAAEGAMAERSRKKLVAAQDIPQGAVITEDMVTRLRAEGGIA